MHDDTLEPAADSRPSLVRAVLLAPLWALPFTLFFGTIFGARLATYRIAFVESLVITLAIRLALWATTRWLIPVLRGARPDAGWLPITVAYTASAVAATYVAAFAIQAWVQHGFLSGPRALLALGLWALLFSTLFAGIQLARHFHEETVRRAAQVERVRAELVRAELRALQAQVNPHFLFNTLNSIAALITENPAAAEDLTTRLADVFRYSLTGSRRERARFADELEFVRTWLSIERVRFGDALRVVERIEPGLEDVAMPALLMQPLVENAVRYAVGSRAAGGEVRIEAARVDGALQIRIVDDGPGFDPTAPARGTGTGLASVRERLRLAGEGHAMRLETGPEHGTRVTLVLPLVAAGADGARA